MDADAGIHPDIVRWVARHQGTTTTAAAAVVVVRGEKPLDPGQAIDPIHLDPKSAGALVVTAAKLAAGFFRPTTRQEIVWVEGDSQLAVGIAGVGLTVGDGVARITIPVRCDQTGADVVAVTLAVGGPDRPAGLYAATLRRPEGPTPVIDAWGEALVAFAWQTLLTLATQVAGALGKDARGNVLVPAALTASRTGLSILPMARHRFAGSSGLEATRR